MNNEYHKSISEITTLYSYCPNCGAVRSASRWVAMDIFNNEQGELVIGQSIAEDKCHTCDHRYNPFKITE